MKCACFPFESLISMRSNSGAYIKPQKSIDTCFYQDDRGIRSTQDEKCHSQNMLGSVINSPLK